MTTIVTRRGHMLALAAAFAVVFSINLSGQSKPAISFNPPRTTRPLNATLADLTRVAPALNQDLAGFHPSGGKLHWVTFWRRDAAQKAQISAALRRNLQFAVPNLISETQAAGGSISTTFRLYKDLSLVSESLDSLLPPGSHEGKGELAALTNDLSDMNRIREELSAYIQQTAASFESKHPELVSSAGGFPKRIIIDDTVPERRSKRQRASAQ